MSSTLSVVIPTLNEEENLPKVLTKLRQQAENIEEIIIVDGYSKDSTVEIAKKHENSA